MTEALAKDQLDSPFEGISRSERAHQLVHSKFYTALYIVLAVLSLISVILSLIYECPGTFYIVLEIIVNTAMIVEVSIRLMVYGKKFWNSWMNIFDLVLVFLCVVTVVFLFMDCSAIRGRGELATTMFLVFRNTIQFFRLFNMIRKNRQHITGRTHNTIVFRESETSEIEEGNLDTVHSGFSPGYILEEESDDEHSTATLRVTQQPRPGLREIVVVANAPKKKGTN
ncbi:hypothetical protein K493DRAFT_320453 [Basidiobolus meristosporus CBS 931.73]|uniref:Ion transport domain-containing protein n=1 Tax=Basidiobolus meristosporus CBS 931.73 TaxID=1314790 RepID=A0A1Y1X9J0_9FUNG|nr:hypothetical protein K493DRAFT_320453 [Basidiobolus meristosporus CBS 931.73]|eukprot:ORX82398.1 hypothetical protein K493DRAFT_320453 [Basidiobolus meristosporus CBS 931.73]